MEDKQIVSLYWERSERAVDETAAKYGRYCFAIAHNILGDAADAEESVNDTYFDAWNSMPPHRPTTLSTFLGKITRRISIDKWRKGRAEKRGSGQMSVVLDELSECIPDGHSVEHAMEQHLLAHVINSFVKSLPTVEQQVFLCRYWYLDSIATISRQFGFSESKVKSMLYRTREKLHIALSKEGF